MEGRRREDQCVEARRSLVDVRGSSRQVDQVPTHLVGGRWPEMEQSPKKFVGKFFWQVEDSDSGRGF